MRRVFITGAEGFIGSYVVAAFAERGWSVTALIHRSRPSRWALFSDALDARVTVVNGDVTDYERLASIFHNATAPFDAVVHCAGRASDVGWRNAFRKQNFESVEHLVRLVTAFDVQRFVFVSTTDVYGLRDFSGERETALPLGARPRHAYPEFKIMAERVVRESLPSCRFSIIRPAQVWGVGDTTLTARIIGFLAWSPWIVNFGRWKGENRWPLAHVKNVAVATFLAATLDTATGKAINILDSERTSIGEFYRMVADTYFPGRKFRSITMPFWVGATIGGIVSALSNLLNLKRPFMDPSLYALYAVSTNLDFSNERFLALMTEGGEHCVTREAGLLELKEESG